MIVEELSGENRLVVALDRQKFGADARKVLMVMDGVTGKITYPQQEDLRVSASIGTEATNAIDVAAQLVDNFGVAVGGAKEVIIRAFAVTSAQGTLAAATAPVGTVRKTNNAATGECLQWMQTSAGGAFSFKVTDTAQELVLIVIEVDGARVASFTLNFALV